MTDQDQKDRRKYGWMMVGITFSLTALSFGILSSVGIFLKPLAAEFGWSRGGLSFGYTTITLSTAFSGVIWGIIADRHGTRWIALFGAFAMTIALLLMSGLNSLWEFYLFHLMFGALGHGALSVPLYANAGLWFTKNIGLALGVTAAGGAFGQGVVPMVARVLITQFGWETAYLVLGIGYFIIALPLALMVRDAPRHKVNEHDGRPLMRDGTIFPLAPVSVIIWLSSAVVFCCITMSVPIVHLVSLLTDRGIYPEVAVSALLALMIAGAFGRIIGGKLTDMIGALKGYTFMSIGQTILVFGFPLITSMTAIYGLAILFGTFYSGVMASFIICARVMIPAQYMARSMSIIAMFGWFGMGLGAWQGGFMYDITGDYFWSFTIASIAGLINICILLLFTQHIRRAKNKTGFVKAMA